MSLHRRSLLLGAAALTTSGALFARQVGAEPASKTIDLWPDAPPGGPGPSGPEIVSLSDARSNISMPRLEVWRPERPNGTAILICGGGGYLRISIGKESEPTARWLASLGVTAFVLVYRLQTSGWPLAAPFQDAQRAMRLIRLGAAGWSINPERVGIIGFSAGGHLAGMTAMRPAAALYPAVDAADALSSRPDFAGLIYPVITLIPPFITKNTTRALVGDDPTLEARVAWSVDHQVTAGAPPTFLVHAANDPIAPPENSLLMFAALRQARVRAALHMFSSGGHGFNLGPPDSEVHAWPRLFSEWAGLA